MHILPTIDGQKIFNLYCAYTSQMMVRRMGFAQCGSSGKNFLIAKLRNKFKPFFKEREQSDTEHVYGALVLIGLIRDFYPEFFINDDEYHICIDIIRDHELGEALGKNGDIPDNGNRNANIVDTHEYKHICDLFEKYLPRNVANYRESLQRGFIDKHEAIYQKAYLIDKLEAIFYNFYLERFYPKRVGSMNWRRKHFGVSFDIKCVAITQSDFPADNWLCHLLCDKDKAALKYAGINIILSLAQSAALETRKATMRWLLNFEAEADSKPS